MLRWRLQHRKAKAVDYGLDPCNLVKVGQGKGEFCVMSSAVQGCAILLKRASLATLTTRCSGGPVMGLLVLTEEQVTERQI